MDKDARVRLSKAMDGVIKKGKEDEWLNTPNKELSNKTPLEIISEGSEGLETVLDFLHDIGWGIPT